MNTNIKEAFEKTRIAGAVASGALDEVKKNQLRVIMRKIDNDQFYFDDIKQGIVQQELRPVKCQNLKGKSEVQKTTDNKRIEDYE